jgi:hypothetical protein
MSRTEESRRIVKRVQEEENQPGPSRIQETRTQNRARCKFCPSNNDNKTNIICKICKKNIFAKRMLFTYVQIVTQPNKYFFYTWDEFYFIFSFI